MRLLPTAMLLPFLSLAPATIAPATAAPSAKEAAQIALRLHGKSDHELWNEMKSIATEKAEEKGWSLLEDAGEKALGTRIKKSDGETLLKTLEAASAGDWEAAAREGGQAIISAYIPLVGQYIAALTKVNEALQAAIRDWVEDLYRLPAYSWLEREVEALYQKHAKIDGFRDNGDPYLPSYRLPEGSAEQKRMREQETRLFSRWMESTTHNVEELQTRYGARIRQVLGKMPTDREIFNHFYHRITRQNLLRYQKTYSTIRSDQLAARTEAAKMDLVRAFRKRIEELAGKDSSKAILVRAYLNEYGGKPIGQPVSNGTILAFEAELTYPPAETAPVTTLNWQVVDAKGNEIAGLGKQEQLAEAGTSKVHRFKFQPEALRNGSYRVLLTRSSSASPAVSEGGAGFKIFQPVSISRLVVAANSEGKKHSETLRPEQAPMLYVYFTVADGVKKVTGELSVRDAASGAVHAKQPVARSVKSGVGEQRVGLGLEPGAVPVGRAIFAASLSAPGGTIAAQEVPFSVESYAAAVLFAATEARSGESLAFTIVPPREFTPPLRITLAPEEGQASMTSETRGTMIPSLPPGRSAGTTRLRVSLTDSTGRHASGQGSLLVTAPAPPPPPIPTSGAWAKALDNTAPAETPPPVPAADPGIDLSDALAKFHGQVADIQARKQQGGSAAQQSPQSPQPARNFYALVSHAALPGQSVSSRTANSCRVVQGTPSLSCGRSQCGDSRYSGPGAELCRPNAAFTSFSRYVGPSDAGQAQAYCNRVAASPTGLGAAPAASSTFFCFPL